MRKIWIVLALLTTPLTASANGPSNLGQLRLGLSESDVSALPQAGLVYLVASLSPYQYAKDAKPVPGETLLSTKVMTPWSSKPLEATLTFKNDALTEIGVTLDEYSSKEVRDQITSKYGEPAIKDDMTQEQCLYHNGANFNISHGTTTYTWLQPAQGSQPIQTSVLTLIIDICPLSLSDDRIPPSRLDMLTIQYEKPSENKNPF